MACGNLAAAPATMLSPIGPQPATTTVSAKVMLARSTACRAHESGSAKAAWAGGMSLLIVCTRESVDMTRNSSMPPG